MSIAAANTSMRVPAGFRNLLEGLAREVLREQPTDVVAFAAQYFQKLLESREGEISPLDTSFHQLHRGFHPHGYGVFPLDIGFLLRI
uniref:RIIa domain-containing protein n=1 Tax=Junco hyemalis TaxID=40217 RepID=A0A8C5JGC6_JUNHY